MIGGSKESEVEKIKKEVSKIVIGVDGVFEEKETLEKRRLSYKIKHETHGIYIAQRFAIEDSQKIDDINRKMNLDPEVLRFILCKTDNLPELKSKEERIAEQEKKTIQIAIKEKSKKTKGDAEVETKKPEKETTQEDIDKKLEEILNI